VPQLEWDALVEEVRDLRTRVARMEMAMGMAAHAAPAAAPIGAATGVPPGGRERFPASDPPPSLLDSPTSLLTVIGRALLGRRKGEKVVVKVPAGDFAYTIVDIS